MSNEFLDYVEDILEAMDKAEILLEGIPSSDGIAKRKPGLTGDLASVLPVKTQS